MENITFQGKHLVLKDSDYVTSGGEGKIYQKGSLVYKIYSDPSKMIPEAKIKEFQALDLPNIIKPLEIVYNKSGKKLLGFTMIWLGDDNIHLPKLFTNTFRDINSINNDTTLELVQNIKQVTQYIHDHKFVIVDGNEFNYMVAKDFITPFFIDVNSWQTPSFPATAIMPSIRDWKTPGFSVLTDWFSFAVVAFQLFVGIHPFKGKHKDYKKNDFKSRIENCVSVLNPKVKMPPTARDFSLIPGAYMDWFFKLFEKGERLLPPVSPGEIKISPVKVILVQSTDNFEIAEIRSFDDKILFFTSLFSNDIVKTEKNLYINKVDHRVSPDVELLYVVPEQIPVMVKVEDNQFSFQPIDSTYNTLPISIECTDKMISNNTLFLRSKDKLIEMSFSVLGKNIAAAPKKLWGIEAKSSQVFSNLVFQDILGKAYVTIPLPEKDQVINRPIPELDDYKILDAKFQNQVAMFVGFKDGVYDRITVIFDKDFKTEVLRVTTDIDYAPLNFVTLDNGICIAINDDGIEVFKNVTHSSDVHVFSDPDINSDMRLCHDGIRVMFFRDHKLYSIKMK